MTKKKTYGEVLEKLWTKHKGKKPYKEVQKMAKNKIAGGSKRPAMKKAVEKPSSSGGMLFNRGTRPGAEYL